MKAKGTGIIAQPVLNMVELKKDVTVELSIKEDDIPTVITCDGSLEVAYQNNLAIFEENVIVKDMRGEILADKMDVHLASQRQEGKQIEGMLGMGIDKVIAEGNVEIHREGNISFSEKAVYDTGTGRLSLTGKPKLVIYSTQDFSRMMQE
jgi:lipopolysaccharide assembly outer membrane protein LptD (OstA)